MDESAQLEDLPEFWQSEIKGLRAENQTLRKRLKGEPGQRTLEELPDHWQKEIRQLRADCARYRTALRDLQNEAKD